MVCTKSLGTWEYPESGGDIKVSTWARKTSQRLWAAPTTHTQRLIHVVIKERKRERNTTKRPIVLHKSQYQRSSSQYCLILLTRYGLPVELLHVVYLQNQLVTYNQKKNWPNNEPFAAVIFGPSSQGIGMNRNSESWHPFIWWQWSLHFMRPGGVRLIFKPSAICPEWNRQKKGRSHFALHFTHSPRSLRRIITLIW